MQISRPPRTRLAALVATSVVDRSAEDVAAGEEAVAVVVAMMEVEAEEAKITPTTGQILSPRTSTLDLHLLKIRLVVEVHRFRVNMARRLLGGMETTTVLHSLLEAATTMVARIRCRLMELCLLKHLRVATTMGRRKGHRMGMAISTERSRTVGMEGTIMGVDSLCFGQRRCFMDLA